MIGTIAFSVLKSIEGSPGYGKDSAVLRKWILLRKSSARSPSGYRAALEVNELPPE